MRKKRILFSFSLALTTILALASCGSNTGSKKSSGESSKDNNASSSVEKSSDEGKTSGLIAESSEESQQGQSSEEESSTNESSEGSSSSDQSGNVSYDSQSTGFGGSYTAFSELFKNSTKTDSKSRKTLGDEGQKISMNGFEFDGKCVLDGTSLNTQASDFSFSVNSKSNFALTGSWGSSDSGKVYIYKGETLVYSSPSSLASKTAISITLDDLEAGTYLVKGVKDKDSTGASLVITTMHYDRIIEYVDVNYVTNCDEVISPIKVEKNRAITNLPKVEKSGYEFEYWCTDEALNNPYDGEAIDIDTTLYAKFRLLTADEKTTVSFVLNVDGESLASIEIKKGSSINRPTKEIEGYRFIDWYSNEAMTTSFDFNTHIDTPTTIYGKYIKQFSITFNDLNDDLVSVVKVDKDTPFSEVAAPNAPYVENKIFKFWSIDGENEFLGSEDITSNVVLKPVYRDQTPDDIKINYVQQEAAIESAYLTLDKYQGAEGYSLYEYKDNNYIKLTNKEYYVSESTKVRIDIFGLTEGNHKFLVAPVIGGNDAIGLGTLSSELKVESYDRSGYAFYNYTDGVGAYKDNGQLKDNAIVLYVTDENKNTITLSYGGITVTGIGNILNSAGQETTEAGHEGECKRVSDGDTYYGKANSNQGIIKILAENNIPLVVRFVGCVSSSGLYQRGAFDATKDPLIDGLTHFNSWDCGGTYDKSDGDQGHMARIQSGKNITLEGVGQDATIDGWGFHFMCQSSSANLGKSFEVRNLKFINTPEDAVGMEGQQSSGVINASVERCWIHNNEFYCPNILNPTVSDKAQGDGSCDFKRGQYFTCSYNYFERCHKTMLVGSSDSSLQFNLTYHHNYFYLCGARGPLARQANIHMYNNCFFGQTDYALNPRANSYIFSEYNLFYACKNPMTVAGGALKSYNDMIASYINDCNGSIVSDKSQTVSNSCKYGSIDYSKFDTTASQSYIPTNDYYLEEDYTEIRKTLAKYCGTAKETLNVNYSLNDLSILNLLPLYKDTTINELQVGNTYNPGSFSKKIYGFKITEYAEVNIVTNGVLVNEAGILVRQGSGSAILTPGTYFVQAVDFQPAKLEKDEPLTFKPFEVTSITLKEYDATEYMNQILAEYNEAVSNIPSNIEFNDSCYNAIKEAMDIYNSLSSSAKEQVTNYESVVLNALNSYKEKGTLVVENLITAIGTVDKNSGPKITEARAAYNKLLSRCSDATVSNYSKLTEAELAFESYAVDACIEAINAIGTVTLDSNDSIVYAENLYSGLNETQQKQVTNYSDLVAARAQYDILIEINTVANLMNNANTYALCQQAYASYNEMSDGAKVGFDANVLSQFNVKYTIKAIDEISDPVTKADRDIVKTARDLYDLLNEIEQASVTNYSKLEAAEEVLSSFATEEVTKEIAANKFTVDGVEQSSLTASVWSGYTYEAISTIKFDSLSKIVLNAQRADASVSFSVSYSVDGNVWVPLTTSQTIEKNNTATDLTFNITETLSSDVYIKVIILGSKPNEKNKKVGTINSVTCTYYE